LTSKFVIKNPLTCNSSSVKFSPNSFATRFKFLNEILPVLSSSKSLNQVEEKRDEANVNSILSTEKL